MIFVRQEVWEPQSDFLLHNIDRAGPVSHDAGSRGDRTAESDPTDRLIQEYKNPNSNPYRSIEDENATSRDEWKCKRLIPL